MDSFNLSCFASGQTIAPGDPMVVIPVLQGASYRPTTLILDGEVRQSYGTSQCCGTPSSYWRPVTGPIWTTYEDCGLSGRIAWTNANRRWLSLFFENLFKDAAIAHLGKKESRDLEFDFRRFMIINGLSREELNLLGYANDERFFEKASIWWPYVMRAMWQGQVFVGLGAHYMEPRQLDYAVLHGHVAELLIEMVSEQKDPSGGSMAPSAFFTRAISKAREAAVSGEGVNRHLLWVQLACYSNELSTVPSAHLAYASALLGTPPPIQEIEDADELYPHFQAYLEFAALLRGLEALNIQFRPKTGAEQDPQNESGLAYSRFVDKACERVSVRKG